MRLKFGATFGLRVDSAVTPSAPIFTPQCACAHIHFQLGIQAGQEIIQLWSICALVTLIWNILTCEWKVFYWRCRGFKDWVTTSKLLFQPREVTGGLQLHFSQSVKNSNLSKSIKFLTKLHFNFIFPPPFCFSVISYIVQFWCTTVWFTAVKVHQQVREFEIK